MTMPRERTRSLIQATEFLRELSKDHELPNSIRNEAKRLLRHYPDAGTVTSLGRFEELLVTAEPDDKSRELAIQLHTPVLSSGWSR